MTCHLGPFLHQLARRIGLDWGPSYGDRVPVTTLGKIVGSFWMACGFILLTVAAAVVTSVLTVERLKPLVGNASQLSRSRIGAVTGTTGARYVDANGLRYLAFSNDELAMNALEEDEIQAVIGSTTTLYYLVEHGDNAHVMVLPRPLLRDYLGFGLRFGFDPSLEKRIELEVVKAAQSAEYQAMRAAMLGDSDAPRISASSTAEGR